MVFYDLGEENIITPTHKNLAKIMNALILCDGKINDIHSPEARGGKWIYPETRSCSVLFRISLPDDKKDQFEELSGYKLSSIPVIGIN